MLAFSHRAFLDGLLSASTRSSSLPLSHYVVLSRQCPLSTSLLIYRVASCEQTCLISERQRYHHQHDYANGRIGTIHPNMSFYGTNGRATSLC